MERLYGGLIDPRDLSGGTRLGVDHGTVGQNAALAAGAPGYRPVTYFFDVAFGVPESVSRLWAELSDSRGEVAEWLWECVMAGSAAAMDYLQDKAGCTSGQDHAHEWVIASFRHATFNVNAKVHVHNAVLGWAARSGGVTADTGGWCLLDRELVRGYETDAGAVAGGVLRTELESHDVPTAELPDGSGWETERAHEARKVFEQMLREPRDPTAEWPPPNQELTPPEAIVLAAIAGQPDILGEERPVFSHEIISKLAAAGITVDNNWVSRMGASLGLKNLVSWRPDMTGDLDRSRYTLLPAGRRWLQVNVQGV